MFAFFCCLVLFVVWAFRVLFVLLFGRGRVFFLLFGRGPRPRPNSKKNTPPPKQQKKTRPRPFRACFFFAVWAGGCAYFFAVWAGCVFFFVLFGRGACFFFLLFGRGRVFFFCLLFGRGRVVFFAVWAPGVFFFLLFGRGTGVHSLTRLPGSSLSDPTTKETEQQNKKHRFRGSDFDVNPKAPKPQQKPTPKPLNNIFQTQNPKPINRMV